MTSDPINLFDITAETKALTPQHRYMATTKGVFPINAH